MYVNDFLSQLIYLIYKNPYDNLNSFVHNRNSSLQIHSLRYYKKTKLSILLIQWLLIMHRTRNYILYVTQKAYTFIIIKIKYLSFQLILYLFYSTFKFLRIYFVDYNNYP